MTDASSTVPAVPSDAHQPDGPLDPALLDELWDFDDPAGSLARLTAAKAACAPGGSADLELATQVARAHGLLGDFAQAEMVLAEVPAHACAGVDIRTALERGRAIRSAGDPAAAVPHFQQAAELAKAAGNDFLLVDALHMLAIADEERALDWTRQALDVITDTSDPRTRRWAGSLRNNLGWALHEQGDNLGALHQFELALEAYQATGKPDQVRIAHWAVARALRSLGRSDEALAIQRRLHESGPADGYVDEEIAELLVATGDLDGARSYFASAATALGADEWFVKTESQRLERLRRMAAGAPRP